MITFGAALEMDDNGGDCRIVIQVGGSKTAFQDASAARRVGEELVSSDDFNATERELFAMLKSMIDAAALSFERVTRQSNSH